MKVHCPRLLSLAFLTLLPMAYGGTLAVGKSTPPPITDKTPPPNPLSFAGGKVVFDVQEKVRFELRENNFDFSDAVGSPTDDSWLLQRFRLGLKWKPTDTFSFYVQGQDIRELDSDRPNVVGQMGAEGDDSFDLLQGWVELGNPKSFSLKAGRQKLAFGDERLVGTLEWVNQSRAFDALKLHIEQPTWTLDLFTGSVVGFVDKEFNESDIFSGAERDQLFSGAYFSTSALGFQTTDAYLLHLDESSATGSTSFFTLGTRWKGLATKLNGWDYTVEGKIGRAHV